MKKTLAELLNPSFDYYRSIGELSRTLQHLLSTSTEYREPGRWGSSGPTEELVNYGGGTNCYDKSWHSSRIICGMAASHRDVTSWQQNHDTLYRCILASLCQDDDASLRWRSVCGIGLQMPLKFPMAYQNQDDEKKAWVRLSSLHGYKLPVSTLNDCHRSVNVLCDPELVINRAGIYIELKVTQRQEYRQRCRSAWDVCFLCREHPKWSRTPRWNCQRETFAAFLLRAVEFYKSVTL
jgi:hypothetical protein